MKKVILLLALALLLMGNVSGEPWKMGSHDVVINLSSPANYTMETPFYSKEYGAWAYSLNITPNSGGYVSVALTELNIPVYGSVGVERIARGMINYAMQSEIGGVKYGTTKYKGLDAFEIYNPAQQTEDSDGMLWNWPETYTMVYQPDPFSVANIQAVNAGEAIFMEVLNSTDIKGKA